MYPLVAIVTPVYNGARYLAETMEAVQAQDYPNLMHIVLNNASTDATPQIIERYANARVPVHVARNDILLPLVANWNAAVAHVPAEAKYFRVLSADDLMAPSYVSRLVDVAERHSNVGVVGSLYHTTTSTLITHPWPSDREVFDGRWAVQRMFLGEAWIPSAHAFYRAEELRRQKEFYDKRLLFCDLDASLRILMRTDLGFVHEDLATTRLHAENVSETVVERYKLNMCEWLHFLERYGAQVLDDESSYDARRLYRRYYVRQLMKWRALSGGREKYEQHRQRLGTFGIPFSMSDYMDAVGDWVLVQLGVRPVWGGFSNKPHVARFGRNRHALK